MFTARTRQPYSCSNSNLCTCAKTIDILYISFLTHSIYADMKFQPWARLLNIALLRYPKLWTLPIASASRSLKQVTSYLMPQSELSKDGGSNCCETFTSVYKQRNVACFGVFASIWFFLLVSPTSKLNLVRSYPMS